MPEKQHSSRDYHVSDAVQETQPNRTLWACALPSYSMDRCRDSPLGRRLRFLRFPDSPKLAPAGYRRLAIATGPPAGGSEAGGGRGAAARKARTNPQLKPM